MADRKRKVLKSIQRLEKQEQEFLKQPFLVPVVRDQPVRVRIGGVVCRMRIDPPDFQGWGVFLPITHSQAMLDRPATMSERRRYFQLLPQVQMIVAKKHPERTLVVPANPSDPRCRTDGLLILLLAEEVELFETVMGRFDGEQFWLDERDESADPAVAAYLRQSLVQMLEPAQLSIKGLSVAQRNAYSANFAARRAAIEQDKVQRQERRLRSALEHAGASLRDFSEMESEYRVTFDFDGRRHTSLISKQGLTVLSAGICLSGMDSDFDLTSLVGVLREVH